MSERNKILATMVRLSTFTVKELVNASGSKESTVQTVVGGFESDHLESWIEESNPSSSESVKTYKLKSDARQMVKDEIIRFMSSIEYYKEFNKRDKDYQNEILSLKVAQESLEKLKLKKFNDDSFDFLCELVSKDLERAKKQFIQYCPTSESVSRKIAELTKDLLTYQAEKSLSVSKGLKQYHVSDLLGSYPPQFQYYKNGFNDFYSSGNAMCYNEDFRMNNNYSVMTGSLLEGPVAQEVSSLTYITGKVFPSTGRSLAQKIKSQPTESVDSVNDKLSAFKKNLRHVAEALEAVRVSQAARAMPKIYVCSAMHDRYSRSLATHIQGRFDTLLNVTCATERIESSAVESQLLSQSDGGAVVIVTLNSNGSAKDLRSALSSIKRIQSRGHYGVVVADQSEKFERLSDANISRENYWPKARDTGLEGIAQYISD